MDTLEWLRSLIIIGHEDEDEGDEGNDEGDDGDAGEGDDGGEGDEGENGDGNDDGEEDVESLKKALREERQARRKAERDAKRAARKKAATKEDKDLKQTQEDLGTERSKTARLAEKLLKQSRDSAILAEARKLGFIDETDALTDEVRALVDFDQDEDDPSDVIIDDDSVKDALTTLADKKPHLVGKGGTTNEGTQRTGTRMGKKPKADNEKLSEKKLKDLYPTLN